MPRTILSFDFGLRRIGVAVGQHVTGSASPLGVVKNSDDGPDTDRIEALIKEWRPTKLIVGMPFHADGTDSDILQNPVREFIGPPGNTICRSTRSTNATPQSKPNVS